MFFKKVGKTSGEIRIIFCSDEELLNINQEYLNHDYYTDIITFPFSKPKETQIDSELYISIDRVKENATKTRHTIQHELHRVIFHGCLHLAGFNDKTEEEQQIMKHNEDLLLKEYFVPRET